MAKEVKVIFSDKEFKTLEELKEDQPMSDFLNKLIFRGLHLESIIEDGIGYSLERISKNEERNRGYLDIISLMVSTLLDYTPGAGEAFDKKNTRGNWTKFDEYRVEIGEEEKIIEREDGSITVEERGQDKLLIKKLLMKIGKRLRNIWSKKKRWRKY